MGIKFCGEGGGVEDAKATEPLTSRDIALQLITERALNKDDEMLLRLMTKRVGVALRTLRQKSGVRSEQMPGMYLVWTLEK